eukprot:RCo016631
MDFFKKLLDIEPDQALTQDRLEALSKSELEVLLLERQHQWEELSQLYEKSRIENQGLHVELGSLKRKMTVVGRQQKMQHERDERLIRELRSGPPPDGSEDPYVVSLQQQLRELTGAEQQLRAENLSLQERVERLLSEQDARGEDLRKEREAFERSVAAWKQTSRQVREEDARVIAELRAQLVELEAKAEAAGQLAALKLEVERLTEKDAAAE